MTKTPRPAPVPEPAAEAAPQPAPQDEGVRVEAVRTTSLVLTAILLALSLWWRSWRVTAGVAAGAALAIVNFVWLQNFVEEVFLKRAGKISKVIAALYLGKYVVTALAIFLAIKYSVVNVLGLMAGIMVVFLAISLQGFLHLRSGRKEEEDGP